MKAFTAKDNLRVPRSQMFFVGWLMGGEKWVGCEKGNPGMDKKNRGRQFLECLFKQLQMNCRPDYPRKKRVICLSACQVWAVRFSVCTRQCEMTYGDEVLT